MHPSIPTKRSRNTCSFSLKHDRKTYKDLHLLITGLLTDNPLPDWFNMQSQKPLQIILIFLPGLDLQALEEHSDYAPYLTSVIQDKSKWSRLETQSSKGYLLDLITMFYPVEVKPPKNKGSGIEQFLLTNEEMIDNNYPQKSEEFKETNQLGSEKGIIAVDCEMVKTTKGLELARVSLVLDSGKVLYDEYVIPEFPVIDYLTQFSGITPKLLNSATKTLEFVQNDFLGFVNSEAVLCGHSLDNDLRVLKIVHKRVADTSLLYLHPNAGKKMGLKNLASKYLNRKIQQVIYMQGGHDSVEDAMAALDLFKMKRKRGILFGMPGCIYHQKNLFDTISKQGVKSVGVRIKLPNELIQGNLSIDHNGSAEKYIGGQFGLVVCQWGELKRMKSEEWSEGMPQIIKDWDARIKDLVDSLENGIVVVVNGEGNTDLANRLDEEREKCFDKWTTEQEKMWRKVEMRLNMNFMLFCCKENNI